MAKWRVYYTTGFLSCSIVWSFLPSLVYRLSNMTEMQATVICNFLKKKNVHNLVTDFMVFLDLFTRKKNSLMNVQVQMWKKMLQTIVRYFTSSFPFFPLPFFLFFVFAFCLFFLLFLGFSIPHYQVFLLCLYHSIQC